jgi:YHS domain-containing protein
MPGADQDHQHHSSSSYHERTYFLSSQKCQEQINTISFIPAPATMRELTSCEANNATCKLRPSASFQLQPPGENILPIKPRMPGAHQDHQLHSSSSHHERTYFLSSQECQEHIKTISFFLATTATLRELTYCQGKNARSRSRPSALFQLQPP